MTDDVELLPLPDADGELVVHMAGRPVEIDAFRPSTLLAYARACVAHATAAKDAEIEALRAELAKSKHSYECAARALFTEAARAERLAEALRSVRELVRRLGPNIRLNGCELLEATITHALHPTAAQESSHD